MIEDINKALEEAYNIGFEAGARSKGRIPVIRNGQKYYKKSKYKETKTGEFVLLDLYGEEVKVFTSLIQCARFLKCTQICTYNTGNVLKCKYRLFSRDFLTENQKDIQKLSTYSNKEIGKKEAKLRGETFKESPRNLSQLRKKK